MSLHPGDTLSEAFTEAHLYPRVSEISATFPLEKTVRPRKCPSPRAAGSSGRRCARSKAAPHDGAQVRKGRELESSGRAGGVGARDVSRGQISQGLEAVMQAGLAPRSRETASWAPLRCEVGRIGHGHLAEKSGVCHGTDLSWPPPPGSSHPEGTGGVGPRQEPDFVTCYLGWSGSEPEF